MELTDQLIGDCSPYIGNFVYDIDVRLVFIELLDSPEQQQLKRRIVFPGIIAFSETNLQTSDEEELDDLVSVQRLAADKLVVTTYKKELLLHTAEEPFVEAID